MSNKVVVDTSIVIKWVIDETDSSIAVALLARWISEGLIILAPSLLAYEITNVLYQRLRKGSITLDEADEALQYVLLRELKLDTSQNYDLSKRAMAFTYQFSLSATYDAHYLALAERENCEFWTADTRLFNAINGKLPWVHKLEDYQALS